jgi:hypothetical protein
LSPPLLKTEKKSEPLVNMWAKSLKMPANDSDLYIRPDLDEVKSTGSRGTYVFEYFSAAFVMLCSNFRTIYGGQETRRNRFFVPARKVGILEQSMGARNRVGIGL